MREWNDDRMGSCVAVVLVAEAIPAVAAANAAADAAASALLTASLNPAVALEKL